MTKASQGLRHPLTRASLSTLGLPEPVAHYLPAITERINTNPFGGEYLEYPCPKPVATQASYAAHLNQQASSGTRGAPLQTENVLFTAGSIAGIDLLVRAFCDPAGDRICTASPTFVWYQHCAVAAGVGVVDIPLAAPNYDRLAIDAMAAANAKLTFVCNPNNPLGCSIDHRDVVNLLGSARGLVVVDEAYVEFSSRPSVASLVPDHDNLVVLRTFSKAWGLAGLRVGAVIAHPSVIFSLRILQDPYSLHVAAQRAVHDRFSHYEQVRSSISRVCAERERMRVEIGSMGAISRVLASDANFLCMAFRSIGAQQRMADAAMLVSDTSSHVPNSARITISTREENDAVLSLLRREPQP